MNIIPIPCSFDNYSYLLICPATKAAAVIDPTEAYPVRREIAKRKVRLSTILCTHHHHDHVGDIEPLTQDFGDIKVVCHSSDRHRIRKANVSVEDGDTVRVGELQGRAIHTPGHTTGSVCYLFGEHLFVGDTLFGAGCGRLFEGDADQMYETLMHRLAVLPDSTKIYFGHEYTRKNLHFALTVEPGNGAARTRLEELGTSAVSTPSTLELEKQTNPFLRSDSEEIRAVLAQRSQAPLQSPVEVFAMLRNLRNDF